MDDPSIEEIDERIRTLIASTNVTVEEAVQGLAEFQKALMAGSGLVDPQSGLITVDRCERIAPEGRWIFENPPEE